MKIKNVKKKVTEVLTKHPKSRDNDMSLLAIVWNEQLGGRIITEDMTAFELLCLLSRKELSNPVSLWRCRQKVQEEQENLRGESWKARQEHSKNVVEEIRTWDVPDNQMELL
tara:strand:- start:2565 stop:2900 length:336 start_codon:yes stop_codon:yes gene_type:complete